MATDPFFALYPRQPTAIPAIVDLIDAYVSEEHTLTLATTAHPIESGSSLTDNAVKQPEQLKLGGWVSDLLPVPGAEVGPLGDRAPDAWAALVKLFEERVPGRLPHDLRRTAIRNLERAGVPRTAAMKMVGHRTEAVYRRYAIADEGLLLDSAKKLAEMYKSEKVVKVRSKSARKAMAGRNREGS